MFEVYCFTSPSGRSYVGITRRGVGRRWREHVRYALRGSRLPFHSAIRKYGPAAFTLTVVASGLSESDAKAAEVEWVAVLGTNGAGGYNATAGGDGASDPRPETRERLAAAHRGRVFTPQACANISASLRGKQKPASTRARMSAAAKARMTPEARAHLSAHWTAVRAAQRAARAGA